MALNIKIFEEQIKGFESYLGVKLSKIQADQYYDNLKNWSDKHFSNGFRWLYKNWKQKTFPLVFDVKDAILAANPQPDYKPLPKTEERYGEDLKRIYTVIFPVMDEIRNQVTNKFCEKYKIKGHVPTQLTFELMKLFYGSKIERNEVYDIQNKKWVPAGSVEKYFNPADYGFYKNMPCNEEIINAYRLQEVS